MNKVYQVEYTVSGCKGSFLTLSEELVKTVKVFLESSTIPFLIKGPFKTINAIDQLPDDIRELLMQFRRKEEVEQEDIQEQIRQLLERLPKNQQIDICTEVIEKE